MDLQECFETLGVETTATPTEVKQAYRDLANVWHPDRFAHNPRLKQKAEDKMREINAAFDAVRSFLLSKCTAEPDGSVVVCPNCGVENIVKPHSPRLRPTCGRCGFGLYDSRHSQREGDWESRVLCSDGTCIGVIGPDGRCTECGKTYEPEDFTQRKAGSKQAGLKLCPSCNVFQDGNCTECPNCNYDLTGVSASPPPKKREPLIKYKVKLTIAATIVFVGFLIYLDYSDKKQSQHPKIPETLTPAESEEPSTLSKQDVEEIIALEIDDLLDSQNFSRVDKASAITTQLNLVSLGYEVGPVDGVLGPKSIEALKQFAKEFCPHCIESKKFLKQLSGELSRNAAIAKAHPEWRNITQTGVFDVWINQQPSGLSDRYGKVRLSGTVKQVINLLIRYKFHVQNPSPMPLPTTGIVQAPTENAVAPFRIRTKYPGINYLIKLVNTYTDKEILSAFIRGGETLSIDVPLGNCELKYAYGETWYGKKFLFGASSLCKKADEVFRFERIGNDVRRYTVELYLQPRGNLSTSEIDPLSF